QLPVSDHARRSDDARRGRQLDGDCRARRVVSAGAARRRGGPDYRAEGGMICRLRALSLAVGVAGALLSAQPALAPIVAIIDTTILPMTSNQAVLRSHTVLVSGHEITQIGPAA